MGLAILAGFGTRGIVLFSLSAAALTGPLNPRLLCLPRQMKSWQTHLNLYQDWLMDILVLLCLHRTVQLMCRIAGHCSNIRAGLVQAWHCLRMTMHVEHSTSSFRLLLRPFRFSRTPCRPHVRCRRCEYLDPQAPGVRKPPPQEPLQIFFGRTSKEREPRPKSWKPLKLNPKPLQPETRNPKPETVRPRSPKPSKSLHAFFSKIL